jgi:hypothetical protein
VVLGTFAFYVAIELIRNGVLGFPLDDPWIHLTFARNLARGWGFAFNQGEPVQGSTAPLWTLILAFIHRFTRNPTAMVWITKILGMVFLWVSAFYGMRIVTHLTKKRWGGLVAGVAIATLSHFGWAMVSGMEVTLSLALVLAGIHYHLAESRGWRAYLPWVLFALAAYTRPEALALIGFLTLDILVRRLAFRQKVMYWRGLVTYAVVLLPYFALNLTLAHSLFPQTYVAKVGRTSLFTAIATGDGPQIRMLLFKTPFMYLGGFVAHLWQANPILTLLAGVGLVLMMPRIGQRGTGGLLIPLVALLYAPVIGMVAPFVRPAFQNGRYIGSPTAVALLAAIAGGTILLKSLRSGSARLAMALAIGALALFNTVSTAIATAGNTASAESSINRQQVAIGKWLARNTPGNATIACNDVGAIGYFANRRVLDVLGLVTPEVVAYRKKRQIGLENLGTMEFIRDRKPDYLVIFPDWFPNLKDSKLLTPVYTTDLPDNTASEWDFVPRVHTIAGLLITGLLVEPARATMVVFKCDWNQDASGIVR